MRTRRLLHPTVPLAVALLLCGHTGTAVAQPADATDVAGSPPGTAADDSRSPAEAAEPAPPAADDAEPEPDGLPEDASGWNPPTSSTEGWDWVLLTTGEWLKGEIGAVRDGDMEIDSDQFGELILDMDDVAAVHAYRPHIYLFEDHSTVTGVGILRGQELHVDGKVMPRGDFMGMVEGKPRERDYWYMKLNIDLSVRKGNTNQATLGDRLFVRRDAARNRFTLDSSGSIGQTEDAINVQKQIATAQLDVFVSKKFYVTPVLVNFTHDRFQNIDARLIPASGVGVHAIDRGEVEWDVEAAGGYMYLNYRGERSGQSDAVARFATRFHADVGDPLEIDFDWNSNVIVTDLGRTFHHGQLTLALEVTDVLDTTISLIYDRVEQPEPDENGDIPTSNDIQLNFGVQLELG